MKFKEISHKQLKVLKFPFKREENTIICDGAVRSGKTVFMIISFILWAMKSHDKSSFAICGKTVQSTERNIIQILSDIEMLTAIVSFRYIRSKHVLEVSGFGHKNSFYVFGGKDESSYMLIQGMTLCGLFFDEVALQPESFVEQAIARTLTVDNAKYYFNCNPEHPEHWFHKKWILDADGENKKNIYHLHFLMEDNPIMTAEKIKKQEDLFSGIFYQRYILGLWVVAEGLVYPHFDNKVRFREFYDKIHNRYYVVDSQNKKHYGKYYVSIDYGTSNPFSAGLWFVTDTFALRIKEYYYNSRETGQQKTDDEYYKELVKFIGNRPIELLVVDPSAASFITLLRRKEMKVIKAVNDVIDGIRITSSYLVSKKILINEKCEDCIREFGLYSWDDKATEDRVVKAYDHALDDIRYFSNTILARLPQFSGIAKEVKTSKISKIINKKL